jgi:hypothetical protein
VPKSVQRFFEGSSLGGGNRLLRTSGMYMYHLPHSLLILKLIQINLVVGDYFKADSNILSITDQAGDLITWVRSKKIVLALLRQNQLEANARVLTVLRAILTRWTGHFHSYERLVEIQTHLHAIIYQDEA